MFQIYFLKYTVKSIEYNNKKDQFIKVLNSIGGKSIETSNEAAINDFISERTRSGKRVLNIKENEILIIPLGECIPLTWLVIQGGFAVAENGAIWVVEKNMGNRLLPFVCEELVVVIKEKSWVAPDTKRTGCIEAIYSAFVDGCKVSCLRHLFI